MTYSLSYSSLIPPNLFILAAMIGIALAWRWRRPGLWVATVATICLYLVSMPVVADLLMGTAEQLAGIMPRLSSAAPPGATPGAIPGAIIVLSADMRHSGLPGEGDTAGPITLERLAEAARQERRLGLPILVSGGRIDGPAADSLAGVMSRALKEDFQVSVRWREDRSLTTFENAAFSAAILRREGVPAAFVVTDPWHMARALWSFYAVGYKVIPMPTPSGRGLTLSAEAFLPQVPALRDSYLALHELVGLAWYVWRHRSG